MTTLSRRRAALIAAALSLASLACQSTEADETAAVADVALDTSNGESGDSSDGASTAEGTDADGESGEPTAADIEEAGLAFEQCLADAGIDLDFGGGGGEAIDGAETAGSSGGIVIGDGDIDPEAFDAAFEECNEAFEGVAGSFEPSPEQEAEFRDAEAAFANCMADEGIELGGEGGSDGTGQVLSFESDEGADFEAIEAAMEECGKLFDEFLPSADEGTENGEDG